MFWPGSEAAIHGVRPEHWLTYDGDMPYDARVDKLLLRRVPADGEDGDAG